MERGTPSDDQALQLIYCLEHILESDPDIDEIGFIHPSQLLLMLCEEAVQAPSSSRSGVPPSLNPSLNSELELNRVDDQITAFWHKDQKLGISTHFLHPLYSAGKSRFFSAVSNYKKTTYVTAKEEVVDHEYDQSCIVFSEIESEVLRSSKVLLLLSGNFGTAWNARKLILSTKQPYTMFMDELYLSSLVLSFAPKTEFAWTHRRWVIKIIAGKCPNLQKILEEESELVEKIAEKSKMNYRAWNHRCWLVSLMSLELVLKEFKGTRNWAGLHVSDNSCFHFRRKLMWRMLYDARNEQDLAARSTKFVSLYSIWKEELDWNEMLIKRYIGREALWFHRRFLSSYWVKYYGADFFGTPPLDDKHWSDHYLSLFIDNELHLLHCCLSLPISEFEDVNAQCVHAAAYILWLKREISGLPDIKLKERLDTEYLKNLLCKFSPERTIVWDSVLQGLQSK